MSKNQMNLEVEIINKGSIMNENEIEAYNYMWFVLFELGQLDNHHFFLVEDYNLTELAEEACRVLDLYEGDDCPQELFELAYEAQHDVLTRIDNK